MQSVLVKGVSCVNKDQHQQHKTTDSLGMIYNEDTTTHSSNMNYNEDTYKHWEGWVVRWTHSTTTDSLDINYKKGTRKHWEGVRGAMNQRMAHAYIGKISLGRHAKL